MKNIHKTIRKDQKDHKLKQIFRQTMNLFLNRRYIVVCLFVFFFCTEKSKIVKDLIKMEIYSHLKYRTHLFGVEEVFNYLWLLWSVIWQF